MKDFRNVFIFIVMAFVIPPILISSSTVFVQVLGYIAIVCAFAFVHALDSHARMMRN